MKSQRILFTATVITVGAVLCWRIANVFPLYMNATIRMETETTLRTVADREGWLLSDMIIEHVTEEGLLVTHRRHIRGNDPETCYVIGFKDASLHPCAAKQS